MYIYFYIYSAGPLRKRRFGGFAGWEALHFCLAGDALFYSLTPSDSQVWLVGWVQGSKEGWTGCEYACRNHVCSRSRPPLPPPPPSPSQPRGTLYLEGSRVKDTGNASFEVFVPIAYSRANLVKEKQVNRVFNFKAESKEAAARWMAAIDKAKPLTDEQLLQERDGHKEGRGFAMDDIRHTFSKVCAVINSYSKLNRKLTFENFY